MFGAISCKQYLLKFNMCCILVADTSFAGAKCSEKVDALFPDLTGDSDDSGVSEIESLCLSCYKQVRVFPL